MRKIVFAALVLAVGAGIVGCMNQSTSVNKPVGGSTQVVDSDRTLELNYDIKKTLDSGKSTDWGCKCEVDEDFTIDGDQYTIFGDCGSQNGNQLVRRGNAYYLISEKLQIRTLGHAKSVDASAIKSE